MDDHPERMARAVNVLLNRFLVRSADGEARPIPYSPVDYQVLRFLSDHADARATDVASHVGTPATTMQSALDRLVRRGLLEKRASDTDGRARLYRLSGEGTRVHVQIEAQDRANMRALLQAVPKREQAVLVDLMERLAE